MAKILQQRLSWRTVFLIACESALIVEAVGLAAWLRLGGGAWADVRHRQRCREGGADRRRLPGLPVLHGPLRSARRRGSARAVRPGAAGARRRVASSSPPCTIVFPDLGLRPRRLLHRRRVHRPDHRRLAAAVRVPRQAGQAGGASPPRGHRARGGRPRARASRAAAGTGRRARGLRRSRPGHGGPGPGEPRRHRRHRRHPGDRAALAGRPRGRQPGGRARQAADGQAARDEAGGRSVRSPRLGLRGVHGQDRRREPAPQLAHLLGGLSQDAVAGGGEAGVRHGRRRRRPRSRLPGDAARRPAGQAHVAGPRALPPAPRRSARPHLHGAQVPVDARRRGVC